MVLDIKSHYNNNIGLIKILMKFLIDHDRLNMNFSWKNYMTILNTINYQDLF